MNNYATDYAQKGHQASLQALRGISKIGNTNESDVVNVTKKEK